MTLFSWPAGELLRLFALTVLSVPGFGQAWTPPRGEGSYAIVFQDLYTTKHTFADGSRADVGHVTLLGLANSVDFGVTDKFAATLSFPVGMGIYNGKTLTCYRSIMEISTAACKTLESAFATTWFPVQ